MVSEVSLVRSGHLELLEQGIADPEVRMLRVTRLRRGCGTESLVYLWWEASMQRVLWWYHYGRFYSEIVNISETYQIIRV
jgi:hypothetical protein